MLRCLAYTYLSTKATLYLSFVTGSSSPNDTDDFDSSDGIGLVLRLGLNPNPARIIIQLVVGCLLVVAVFCLLFCVSFLLCAVFVVVRLCACLSVGPLISLCVSDTCL